MSSIPNNGLVTIQFQVDRSPVDAYLAELRKGVTIPARFGYEGPAGPTPGTGPSAGSIAGANGPATFGNLSGAPVYGSGPSGIFAGGPGQGIAAMSVATMSYGYSSAAYSGPGGASGAVSSQAATEIKTAASTFSAAVGQLVGALKGGIAGGSAAAGMVEAGALVGPSGPSAGEEGGDYGGNRRRGWGPFGISRYAAPFIATDIALQAAGAGRQYMQARSGAAGDPRGLANAELGLFDRVSNLSIFGLPIGQVGAMMVDPIGAGRAGIQDTLDAAGYQDAVGQGRWNMNQQRLTLRDQATIAGSRGFTRTENEIRSQHRVSIEQIDQQRRDQTQMLQSLGRAEVQGIEDKHKLATMMPGWLSWMPGVQNSLNQMGREEDAQQSTQSQRIKSLDPVVKAMKDAADAKQRGDLAENQRKLNLAHDVLTYQRGASIWRSRGMEGYAKEQEFWAKGAIDILSADPALLGATTDAVSRERAGHNAMLKFDIAFERQRNTAISQRLEYRGVEASITDIRAETDRQVREQGRNAAEVREIRTQGAGREAEAIQQAHDRFIGNLAPLAIQNQSMRIQLGATSPQMGSALAAINNIAQGSVFQGFETMHRQDLMPDDRQKLAKSQIEHGQLQLQQFQQEFFRSNQPRQIQSINQQALNGPGTANTAKIEAEVSKAAGYLQGIFSHVATLTKDLERIIQDSF